MLDLNHLEQANRTVLKQFCKDNNIVVEGDKRDKDSYIVAIIEWNDK